MNRLAAVVAVACLCAVAGQSFAAGDGPPLPQKFDPSRDAMKDLETAKSIAAREHKRILVDVGGEWCSACREVDRAFAENPDLLAARDAKFVLLRVNVSKDNPNKAFMRRMPWFIGYPHWFVLDRSGKVLNSSLAHAGRKDFLDFAAKWADPQS